MEWKYFDFCSKNYLSTYAARPLFFTKILESNNLDPEYVSKLYDSLQFGDYPDSLTFPVEFDIFEGEKCNEVIDSRWLPSVFLISDRLKNLFTENHLTGWQSYDIVLRTKKGEIMTGFNGFSVTGRNPRYASKKESPDFFQLKPGMGYVICNQKVVNLLKANKIKDFRMEPITPEKNADLYKKIHFAK